MSKSNNWMGLAVLLAACVAPGDATHQRTGAQSRIGNEPISLTLGTATPGGGFPVYGDAFVATVGEADPAISIKPVNTKGSAENVPLLEAGKLDIALVQGEAEASPSRGVRRARDWCFSAATWWMPSTGQITPSPLGEGRGGGNGA